MKYLKVYTDFIRDMTELSDAEKGRLFVLMLTYAETGTAPTPAGNERFVWGTASKMIDAQRDAYEKKSKVNTENIQKRWDTKRYETIRNDTNGYEKYESYQEQEQEQEQEHKSNKRFKPPTLDDVKAYCSERNNSVDAERFIDFYQSKGWKVGNQPMKDWKAAVRTWERKRESADKRYNGQNFTQKVVRMEELENTI